MTSENKSSEIQKKSQLHEAIIKGLENKIKLTEKKGLQIGGVIIAINILLSFFR